MSRTPDLPPPRAVIFDLDGTLVDTVGARIRAWMRVFEEEGIPAGERHVAELIGSDGKRLARAVATRAGRELSEEEAARVDRRSGAIYSEINTDPRPLPGASDLLRELDRRGVRWAIATSSLRDQVGASVAALRLGVAPRIVDGSGVSRAKPAPDLLLAAAEQLGMPPRECWYVGDATPDMAAAAAAGMPAVGVTAGSAVDAEALRGSGASIVLATLDEVRELLPPG
ncbi:MAG TPA: HAD-IA family hydrolase [Candidatus Limnocylindria bacterium]|nr:HAD-IA family hydrolase [Candidatus Limnocylindria bacterium]